VQNINPDINFYTYTRVYLPLSQLYFALDNLD